MESSRKKQKVISSFFKSATNVSKAGSAQIQTAQTSEAEVVRDTDETETLAEKPNQPGNSFPFPKSAFGKQLRSCQSLWFQTFSWLDYNERDDSVTCFTCKRQKDKLISERNKEETFFTTGCKNWKKALDIFSSHEKSKCHLAALTNEVTVPLCGNVSEMMDKAVKDNMMEDRRCFLKVLETLQFLGRQGIALRGDESDADSNFIQLLKLRSKDVPELTNWLQKKTEKYTSHDIQNEIIMLMAHQIVRDISEKIRDSFYAIICDEYTDVSNKEQLTFCLRWVDNCFNVQEEFLGFYEVQNIKSNTIVFAIKDILLRIQISLDKCRGQCYDGASNMLGKKSGVAKQIFEIQPKAHYTHCHCHSLSLSVNDLTKQSKLLSDTMDTAGEITILIKFSPKRETMLNTLKEGIIEEDGDAPRSIMKLSTTRWTVRATSFQRILDNYILLYNLWSECLKENLTKEVKSRIIGCKSQMESFAFYFGLKLGKLLYSHTDNLSKTLQSEKMSAVGGKRLASLTVEVIEGMRNEETFNMMYDSCVNEAKKISFVEEPVLKRKRIAPNYSILQYVEGYNTSSTTAHHPETPRDHYRSVFYGSIDALVSSVRERFDQPSFLVFEQLESLLLKALQGQDISKEAAFASEKYETDIDLEQLKVELQIFKVMFKDKDVMCYHDVIEQMRLLPNEEKKLIKNVCVICKLLAVNPATSATAERTFSMARRVKTWMRSTMLPSRFNSLAILNFHKSRTDTLDLIKVANLFSESNDNRKRIFGQFSVKDIC